MDWTPIIDLMKEINVAQLAVMSMMMWAMYSRLDAKIEKLATRLDKLSDKVDNIDRRLCRIEGMIAAGTCCLLKNTDNSTRAE